MRRAIIARTMGAALVLVLAGTVQANLLVNGGFEAGGASPCTSGWQYTSPSFPPATCKYDGTTHTPTPAVKEGAHRGSTDVNTGSAAESHVYQVVNVVPGLQLHLVGYLFGGTTGPVYNYFVRLRDGANLSAPVIVAFESTQQYVWHPIDLSGAPTGTQVVVEWGFSGPALNWGIVAAHADAFVLTQASPVCTGEPTVTSTSKNFGVSGSTLTGLQISGTNFDATCQVVLRASGMPDIEATNEVVSGGGTVITCDLPLTGAAMGKRNLVIIKSNCNGATVNNAFTVVLPTLTNGSFESPSAPSSCPNPPTPQGRPDNWLQMGVSTMDSHLRRSSDQNPPACPRPDRDQYASIEIPVGTSIAYWAVYQYVAVTPGQPITVSGMFAGGGRTTVRLSLYDGDEDGPSLANRVIEQRTGCPAHVYTNWVPASASAVPTQGYITVMWIVQPRMHQFAATDVVNVSHADRLVLTQGLPPAEICDNGIDDNGDRRTDCFDPECSARPECATLPTEICGDGLDNDGDLAIDCDDTDCAASCVEICGNNVDDDGDCLADEDCTEICDNDFDDNENGLIDCADPECTLSPLCAEDCANGLDDNNNGLVDCYDPVCASFAACACNDPASDHDGDHDVDMTDFAAWQRCFTTTAAWSQACICFDHDRDGDVDEPDMLKLINCALGPNVPVDPACD